MFLYGGSGPGSVLSFCLCLSTSASPIGNFPPHSTLSHSEYREGHGSWSPILPLSCEKETERALLPKSDNTAARDKIACYGWLLLVSCLLTNCSLVRAQRSIRQSGNRQVRSPIAPVVRCFTSLTAGPPNTCELGDCVCDSPVVVGSTVQGLAIDSMGCRLKRQ